MRRKLHSRELWEELSAKDDAFQARMDSYESNFIRMIPIIALIERERNGSMSIVECGQSRDRNCNLNSAMTDRELGLSNSFDDGNTWAELWLRHPNLEHIVMCYAIHSIATHFNYSVVNVMRMNCFEVRVVVDVRQASSN